MALLDRLARVVRANLNDLRASDDPRAIIEETIAELRSARRTASQDQLKAQAASKLHLKRVVEIREEAERWADRAALAVRSGDETLARKALREKLLLEGQASRVQEEADAHQAAGEQLDAAGKQLEQQAHELTARKATLIAEVMTSRAANQPPVVNESPFAAGQALSNATDRILALEAEVEANQALTGTRRARLEAEFAAKFATLTESEESDEVEDALAGLKAQLAEPKTTI